MKKDSKVAIALGKAGMKLKQHSPKICLVAGIVGTAGALALTVKAAMDTHYILDERDDKVEEIKTRYEEREDYESEYTEEDRDHDIKVANKRAILELARMYAPAAGLYLMSMILIVEGHHILEKRNAALSTAVAAGQAALAGYRKRVASFVGEDEEKEIWNGKKKVVNEVVDEETGEVHEEETIEYEDTQMYYSRCFDETCAEWKKDAFANRMFLENTQKYLNDLLQARACGRDRFGWVYLNEVYDALGFEHVPEGQMLGWYYTEDHKSEIDFGMYKDIEARRRFMNGVERNIYLDMNFDGNLLDFMKRNNIKSFG